ncbi:lytic transglycosylase domain-containing protein [Vogesella sp. LIG4]|uniref:lytic transglycosylase domain-containing protein n=1 Tax=Vogesella sp. LIG4 TaxID=1192162 RepID=UPI00081FBDF8|nr:lytic transglycosylase domain-containing protein [Vogesella sp. LIG4]SCK25274.1 soluble lytic murein transglycosylase [Vogesella sp. LIG4]
MPHFTLLTGRQRRPTRAAWLRPLALALALLPTTSHALSDTQLFDAREAYRKGDLATLTSLGNQAENGVLDTWPAYWQALKSLEAGDSNPARIFVNRYRSGYQVERVLNELIKDMGRRFQWDDILQSSPALNDSARDDETACYISLAMLQRRQSVRPSYDYLDTSQSEGCARLIDEQASRQLLARPQVEARLRLLLLGNFVTVARRLALAAEVDGDFFNPGSNEQRVQAIVKLGKSNYSAAVANLQNAKDSLSTAQTGFAWGQLALAAAKRLDMVMALDAFPQADPAQLTDEQWEWWLRAALRRQDWVRLEQITRALPADLAAKPAWQYWRARALTALGRGTEANPLLIKTSFEHNYYGLLAREELGTALEALPEKVPANPALQQQLAAELPVRQSLALFALSERSGRGEWREEGRRVWRWAMRDRSDEQLLAAAELARSNGLYDMAIYSADRTKSSHDFGLRYLAPYREITKPYAQQLEIDEAWVYGLIRQESRFYNVARSGVGASGLMQLMPATARWVANKIGLGSYQVNDIDTNIRLGTWYLRHVLDSMDDQPVLATAAYNAGPARARSWQGEMPLEGAIYAETIPFNETRDYVQKVMANAVYYAGAFRQNGGSLKQRLGMIPPR